jgi:hypothetical protein
MALPAVPLETSRSYWERKNEELTLLRSYLDESAAPPVEAVKHLVEEKLLLRARMIARFIERNPYLTESNLSGTRSMELDGSLFDFSYQRYDMRVKRKPFAPWIYPTLASPRFSSIGLLAASGMSAVSAVLTSLDLGLAKGRKLYLAPDVYYETRQFAAGYLWQLESTPTLPEQLASNGVLLLDSISRAEPLEWIGSRQLDPLAAVLLDTTCYDVSAPEIERVVERCFAEGVLCVLVRSHIKIDTLGLEYGRLGSIVIVLPRPCDRTRSIFAKRLRRRVSDFLIKTGSGFSPHTYFPLSSDASFRRLNGQRNSIMRQNNLGCVAALCEAVHARSETRIWSYHHGRFIFLRPAVEDWSPPFARSLQRALQDAGVYARVAPSFAYDFLGISGIKSQQYQTGGGLRISLPDYPGDVMNRFMDAMKRFAIELPAAKGAAPRTKD